MEREIRAGAGGGLTVPGAGVHRVRLGLLEMRLSRRALLIRCGDEGRDGELGECDRRDQWFIGEHRGIVQFIEHDDRGGIEDAARVDRKSRTAARAASLLRARRDGRDDAAVHAIRTRNRHG